MLLCRVQLSLGIVQRLLKHPSKLQKTFIVLLQKEDAVMIHGGWWVGLFCNNSLKDTKIS